jgi:hypothetical protein
MFRTTVKLGYDVMKGYVVVNELCSEGYNITVNSETLTGTTEHLTL